MRNNWGTVITLYFDNCPFIWYGVKLNGQYVRMSNQLRFKYQLDADHRLDCCYLSSTFRKQILRPSSDFSTSSNTYILVIRTEKEDFHRLLDNH